MSNILNYTLEELQEAIRLKEKARLAKVAAHFKGRFQLTLDITKVSSLLNADMGSGFMATSEYERYISINVRHHKKGDWFSLNHNLEENCDFDGEPYHTFEVQFDNSGGYYESHVNTEDIDFILENSNFYESIKDEE